MLIGLGVFPLLAVFIGGLDMIADFAISEYISRFIKRFIATLEEGD